MTHRRFNFKNTPVQSRIPPAQRDLILADTLGSVFGHASTGSLADYDNLAEAVAAYDASPCVTTLTKIRPLAVRCGMPDSGHILSWSRGRLVRYRGMTAEALMGVG